MWRVVLAVVVGVNTIVMWSDAVAAWWSSQVAPDDDGESVLPGPIRAVLEARPDLGDAELHALAWAVAAFVAVLAVVGARPSAARVAAAAGPVWAWSVVVEALQPVVSETRAFEWIDVAGNTVGVVLGAAVAAWWRVRSIRRRPGTFAPGGTPGDRSSSVSGGPDRGSVDARRSRWRGGRNAGTR